MGQILSCSTVSNAIDGSSKAKHFPLSWSNSRITKNMCRLESMGSLLTFFVLFVLRPELNNKGLKADWEVSADKQTLIMFTNNIQLIRAAGSFNNVYK